MPVDVLRKLPECQILAMEAPADKDVEDTDAAKGSKKISAADELARTPALSAAQVLIPLNLTKKAGDISALTAKLPAPIAEHQDYNLILMGIIGSVPQPADDLSKLTNALAGDSDSNMSIPFPGVGEDKKPKVALDYTALFVPSVGNSKK
jgi:hypothetical protein